MPRSTIDERKIIINNYEDNEYIMKISKIVGKNYYFTVFNNIQRFNKKPVLHVMRYLTEVQNGKLTTEVRGLCCE